ERRAPLILPPGTSGDGLRRELVPAAALPRRADPVRRSGGVDRTQHSAEAGAADRPEQAGECGAVAATWQPGSLGLGQPHGGGRVRLALPTASVYHPL